jgi:alpha-L-rhamnosidase
MRVSKLLVDYMVSPVGYDFEKPSLSWVMEADGYNRKQSAYRLQVGLDGASDSPLYDSGKVDSDQSVGIRFEMPLQPRTRYYWRVMVWDEMGSPSAFSEPAYFETGRYSETWEADWIGWDSEALPALRKSFTLDRRVKSARLYACGVGLYKLFLNGDVVSDEVLTPGFCSYDMYLPYQTYDVASLLRGGDNAIGAWLGDGYYKGRVNCPGMDERRNIYGDRCALIAELIVEYEDGKIVRIPTDTSWKAAPLPFLRAEIYDGEVFDARLSPRGWNTHGFDDSGWDSASVINIDKSLLTARKNMPIRVTERLPVQSVIHTPSGETVLDFGQNMAGWIRFKTNQPVGDEVKLQFGEALDKDGNFYRDNLRTALGECVYRSDGKLCEYAPCFTFYGFRYVKITGYAGPTDPANFTAEVVHSDLEQTGHFTCSDERVNRLFQNALWGQRGNFVDVPTDCPQRDERMGWTGDAQVFCATACMNMMSDTFYRKYLFDLASEQRKLGFVPVVAPNLLQGTDQWTFPTTGWSDAAVIIPWRLYEYYGDIAILEAQYASMKAWVEYMRSQDTRGVNRYSGFHIGDWLAQDTRNPDNPIGLTPTELLATAYYALSTGILAQTADVLGYEDDAAEYTALASRIKEAFRNEFVTPNGRVAAETQTAGLVALGFDLLKPEQRGAAAAQLRERLTLDGLTLTTGFLGTPLLCPVLSDCGLNEYAYALLFNTNCPSWLYEVEHGATTIWERWNSVREDGTFGPVSMNSLNHYAFGCVAEWMYRYVCGINPTLEHPGFQTSVIKPQPNSLLRFAEASVQTMYGTLSSSWKLDGGMITIEINIPCNTQADIILPDADGAQVLENGIPVEGSRFVKGSGRWVYTYNYSGKTIDARAAGFSVPV